MLIAEDRPDFWLRKMLDEVNRKDTESFPRLPQLSRALHYHSQQDLIRELLHEAAHQWNIPHSATPSGYTYAQRETGKEALLQPNGKALFLSPHPSDVSGDFFPLLIHHLQELGMPCEQLLLTRGEHGDSTRTPAETIAVRCDEEARAAAITGINVEYLTRCEGASSLFEDEYYFPDGDLLAHMPALIERLAHYIKEMQPRCLALPSLYPDHPDHMATAIAAIHAVLKLRAEGFFQEHGPIEILSSDPEFAVATGQIWAVESLPKAYGGQDVNGRYSVPLPDHFHYRYMLDRETGQVVPVPDITAEPCEEQFIFEGPVAVPPVIITASDHQAEKKLKALAEHQTQVLDKRYGALIPMVDRLRGLQVSDKNGSPQWGTGVYPIHIPGVTDNQHSVIDALPQGSVYQLRRADGMSR